jgi:hypothetical protein
MSKKTGTTTITVIISLIVASAIFAATAVNAPQYKPQPYTSQRTLENGLVASIRFTNDTYNAISWVSASYEYYNPTDNPINATLPRSYPVYSGYEGQTPLLTPYRLAHLRNVTIPPRDTLSVIDFNCPVIAPGTYTVSLNGTFSSVIIRPTTLVLRVVTDSETYKAGHGGGTATLEVYNPSSSPLSHLNFGHIRLIAYYVGDKYEDYQFDDVMVDFISMYTTVQPGESHRIWSFYFSTPKPGTLILDFNGVVKTVKVLP